MNPRRWRLLPEGSNKLELLYLCYLAFFFVEPFFRPLAWWEWLAMVAAVLVFLPLYLGVWWVSGRDALWLVVGMVVLGFVMSPINSGSSVFYIYAAATVGEVARTRKEAVRSLALVLLVPTVQTLVFSLPWWYMLNGTLLAGIIGLSNIQSGEVRRSQAKLRMAQEEVEQLATVAERERIARDLHDLLGHTLSVITLKSELAAKLAERDPVRAAGEMRDVERISREALSEVRVAVRGYRARGLKAELANAKLALEAANISHDYFLTPVTLSASQEGVLALALREAVTNVVRHARAGRCTVRLSAEGREVALEVEDDGRGGALREGSGLSGMRERVAAQGGRVTLSSERGTRVRVALPYHTEPAEPASARAAIPVEVEA